jgi:hypothetical protein
MVGLTSKSSDILISNAPSEEMQSAGGLDADIDDAISVFSADSADDISMNEQ